MLHWLTYVQILEGCIPNEVYQYLSDAPDAPKHSHESIILNLACGPSVLVAAARQELLEGCVRDFLCFFPPFITTHTYLGIVRALCYRWQITLTWSLRLPQRWLSLRHAGSNPAPLTWMFLSPPPLSPNGQEYTDRLFQPSSRATPFTPEA